MPTNTVNTPAKSQTSKLLAHKRVEDILAPKPIFVKIGETEHRVLPMPDSSLMHVADSIREIVAIIQTVVSLDEIDTVTADELLPLLPQFLQVLLPHATAIICGSLQVEEDYIQEHLTIAGRVKLLELILEVEDIPLLLQSFSSLTAKYSHLFPTTSAKTGDSKTPEPETPGTETASA